MRKNDAAYVLVVSSSVARGDATDTTGPELVEWLRGLGFATPGPVRVSDGHAVADALEQVLRDEPAVVITTGGTGLTPDDATPEMTSRFVERRVPGIEQALVAQGLEHTPHAALSRGIAGVAGSTLVINLPGSRSAVRDAMVTLAPVVPHACDQIANVRTHGRGGEETGQLEGAQTSPTSAVVATRITHDPCITDAASKVITPECGAVVEFSGVIRNHDSGRGGVVGLDYTCHPDAEKMLAQVVREVAQAHPGTRVLCEHRVGSLQVGDVAIVVAVAAAHRKAAFDCCEDVVNQVKARVPIWKQQHYDTGGHDWVGLQ
ncbi:molybdenum cofactor biosynthesis protein MoaE [Brevibacterium sp. UMB10442]|nr:molybdenum cofactor biosynthesis protein MoaE [Brevibacterium sp. UMB10442]